MVPTCESRLMKLTIVQHAINAPARRIAIVRAEGRFRELRVRQLRGRPGLTARKTTPLHGFSTAKAAS